MPKNNECFPSLVVKDIIAVRRVEVFGVTNVSKIARSHDWAWPMLS